MTFATARCHDCRAPIWFGRTIKDKRQPLDVHPVSSGTVVVDQVEMSVDQLAGKMDGARVRTLRKDEVVSEDVPRYSVHAATCKKPKKPRRRAR